MFPVIIPLKSLTLSVKCSRSATEMRGAYRFRAQAILSLRDIPSPFYTLPIAPKKVGMEKMANPAHLAVCGVYTGCRGGLIVVIVNVADFGVVVVVFVGEVIDFAQ